MKDLKQMGDKIRQARQTRGLSLADLGAQVGVDRTLISKIENGHYQPTEAMLQKIIDTFCDDKQLGAEWAAELWALSGRPSGPVIAQYNQYKEIFMNDQANNSANANQAGGQSVQIDPLRTPILYSDAVGVTSSEFGMVFDFGQRVGPTNNANIVARIGVSYEHARKLLEVINDELAKNEK